MNGFIIFSLLFMWLFTTINLIMVIKLSRRVASLPQPVPFTETFEFLSADTVVPPFSAKTVDGGLVHSSDLLKGFTSLVFVAPHCSMCKEKIESFNNIQEHFGSRGVSLILVSDGNQHDTMGLVGKNNKLRTIVAPRGSNSLFDDYQINITPSYILLRENKVIAAGFVDTMVAALTSIQAAENTRIPA